MRVEEALRRAIARIPASEEGPLTVGIEVDRFGNATATLDFEMTESNYCVRMRLVTRSLEILPRRRNL